jgi:hypothetical protein
MLKQTKETSTAHKIRNHLTIIQNEVLLSDEKTLELTKKIVKNEIEIVKNLLVEL